MNDSPDLGNLSQETLEAMQERIQAWDGSGKCPLHSVAGRQHTEWRGIIQEVIPYTLESCWIPGAGSCSLNGNEGGYTGCPLYQNLEQALAGIEREQTMPDSVGQVTQTSDGLWTV